MLLYFQMPLIQDQERKFGPLEKGKLRNTKHQLMPQEVLHSMQTVSSESQFMKLKDSSDAVLVGTNYL